jgi:hypothetical protein
LRPYEQQVSAVVSAHCGRDATFPCTVSTPPHNFLPNCLSFDQNPIDISTFNDNNTVDTFVNTVRQFYRGLQGFGSTTPEDPVSFWPVSPVLSLFNM